MSVAHARRISLAVILSGLFCACAPERVDINVHDIFTGDAARYALQNQMPAATLAEVGGYLPTTTWPPSATPLLLDVKVVAQNKIDLGSSNITPGDYSGLRMHWTTLQASRLGGQAALSPRPTQLELYVGPSTATSITDPGVTALASGAYPAALDASPSDAGPFDAGSPDAGASDEGTSDAGTSDAGTSDAGTSDAGTADAGASSGAGSSDAGAAGQTLVFTADAQVGLAKLVFANQPFTLFVVLHVPIDTAADPTLPNGGADLQFDIQFELAR